MKKPDRKPEEEEEDEDSGSETGTESDEDEDTVRLPALPCLLCCTALCCIIRAPPDLTALYNALRCRA